MHVISFSAARGNLGAAMDKVCADHVPIMIARRRGRAVVMMSLKDFEAFEETASLLRSPANVRRLMGAIGQLEAGKGRPRKPALDD